MNDLLSMTAAQVEALSEDVAAEVLRAWVGAKKKELPEALARSTSKVHARLAKKALYQLKSSGVEVASPAPAGATAPAPATPGEELPCVLSPVLGTGDRAIFFSRPMRGGGVEVVQGILNDELGITLLERGESNRGTYRKRMNELRAHPDLKVLLVPWERMKVELGRALALCERARTVLEPDADHALRRFGVTAIDPDFTVPTPEPGDEALAINAASLATEPELAQWLPPDTLLTALVQETEAVAASPLALTEAQKRERLEAKALELAKGFLTPAMRKVYARRLWAMAELLEATARPAQGGLARAEARRLYHSDAPSRFVERIFHRAVELAQRPTPPPDAPASAGGRMSLPPGLSRP